MKPQWRRHKLLFDQSKNYNKQRKKPQWRRHKLLFDQSKNYNKQRKKPQWRRHKLLFDQSNNYNRDWRKIKFKRFVCSTTTMLKFSRYNLYGNICNCTMHMSLVLSRYSSFPKQINPTFTTSPNYCLILKISNPSEWLLFNKRVLCQLYDCNNKFDNISFLLDHHWQVHFYSDATVNN
jgi:hypothetical protein